jgi:hypothetical protein
LPTQEQHLKFAAPVCPGIARHRGGGVEKRHYHIDFPISACVARDPHRSRRRRQPLLPAHHASSRWWRRTDCAPLAGKSTFNRLKRGGPELTRYHRIAWDGAKIEALFVDVFLEAH